VAGDGTALLGSMFVLGEASSVATAGDLTRAPSARLALTGPASAGSTPNASVPVFSSRSFTKHGKDELKIAHVVAEVLAVEFFVARVFSGSEAESGQGNIRGEDGVFARGYLTRSLLLVSPCG